MRWSITQVEVPWHLLLLVASFVVSAQKTYDRAQVLRIFTENATQLSVLSQIVQSLNNGRDIDIWMANPRIGVTDIMVNERDKTSFKERLIAARLRFNDVIPNVQRLIDETRRVSPLSGVLGKTTASFLPIEEIYKTMAQLADAFPGRAAIEDIGRSQEGRPLRVLKISGAKPHSSEKRGVLWIDAGSHGREWIAPATALTIAALSLNEYEKYKDLFDDHDWYLLPVSNPDGYAYSHSVDRLWSKTRTVHDSYKGAECWGVDPNKNWDYLWKQGNINDSLSLDPCSRSFLGPKAFSEPSTSALQAYLTRLRTEKGIAFYLTLQSYSQMWMRPWTNTGDPRPKAAAEQERVAQAAVRAMQLFGGRVYDVGTASDVRDCIHEACLQGLNGGSPLDWVHRELNTTYAYRVGLRDGPHGMYGFLLPQDQVAPTAGELLAGIRAALTEIKDMANPQVKNRRFGRFFSRMRARHRHVG